MLNYDFLNKNPGMPISRLVYVQNVLLAADYKIDDVIVNGSLLKVVTQK